MGGGRFNNRNPYLARAAQHPHATPKLTHSAAAATPHLQAHNTYVLGRKARPGAASGMRFAQASARPGADPAPSEPKPLQCER